MAALIIGILLMFFALMYCYGRFFAWFMHGAKTINNLNKTTDYTSSKIR